MRGLNLLTELLLGELIVNESVPTIPAIPAGVDAVCHTASRLCDIALMEPAGIVLNGTGLAVPGKKICSFELLQLPAPSKVPVHKLERSPLRNAAFGTNTLASG